MVRDIVLVVLGDNNGVKMLVGSTRRLAFFRVLFHRKENAMEGNNDGKVIGNFFFCIGAVGVIISQILFPGTGLLFWGSMGLGLFVILISTIAEKK